MEKEKHRWEKCDVKVAKLLDYEDDACSNCSNHTNFTFLGQQQQQQLVHYSLCRYCSASALYICLWMLGCLDSTGVFWKAQNSTVSVLS